MHHAEFVDKNSEENGAEKSILKFFWKCSIFACKIDRYII